MFLTSQWHVFSPNLPSDCITPAWVLLAHLICRVLLSVPHRWKCVWLPGETGQVPLPLLHSATSSGSFFSTFPHRPVAQSLRASSQVPFHPSGTEPGLSCCAPRINNEVCSQAGEGLSAMATLWIQLGNTTHTPQPKSETGMCFRYLWFAYTVLGKGLGACRSHSFSGSASSLELDTPCAWLKKDWPGTSRSCEVRISWPQLL